MQIQNSRVLHSLRAPGHCPVCTVYKIALLFIILLIPIFLKPSYEGKKKVLLQPNFFYTVLGFLNNFLNGKAKRRNNNFIGSFRRYFVKGKCYQLAFYRVFFSRGSFIHCVAFIYFKGLLKTIKLYQNDGVGNL